MAPVTAATVSNSLTINSIADFPRFDVVDADPSDHYFFFPRRSNFTTETTSQVTSQSNYTTKAKFDAIMLERKRLEQDTPDSIFIRAYKCEVSLLRVAFVGLPSTPYHNFLFFFDICLPPNYPSIWPKIHYQRFDVMGISPALGINGEVLFSCLKDVGGKPSKRWNPKSSTLLQFLLAVQALVFVEKPYYDSCFRIPFAGKNARERWAAEYNDKVLQRCCVVAANILKHPPRNFEAFVATHFRQRGLDIVTTFVACRERIAHKNTFKVYSELVLALAKNGAHVGYYVEQVEVEKESRELAKKKEKKIIDKLSGLFSKNSTQIGSNRYVRLKSDEEDM